MIKTKQMAIPNRQIGWSNESNLLWNISSQLDRLTKVIANLSPGGGTNIYNSNGTLTGNRQLNGGNNELNFVNLAQFYGTNNATYQFEFDQNGVLFYDGTGEIRIDRNSDTTFIGMPGLPNRYGIIVDNANPFIKTIYQNTDIGLKLDFGNEEYSFGDPVGTKAAYFRVAPQAYLIGTMIGGQSDGIMINYDDQTEIVHLGFPNKTGNYLDLQCTGGNPSTMALYSNNNPNGISINGYTKLYQLGQLTGGNATYLTIDDAANYPVQLTGTNISSGTAGAASGQFLKIKVGGVDYKIALLNP